MSEQPALSPELYRRNALAFGAGMALFAVGESIFGANTIIPAYVSSLTDSQVLVGLASGLNRGAWLLPQMFFAGYVTRLPLKRPFMVRMAFMRGPSLLPLALGTWLISDRAPGLALALLLLSIVLFYVLDAGVTVPFMDLMARGLPARRRGRVQGAAGMLGGLGGIGAGVLVRLILAKVAYPLNFAVLFGLATVVFSAVSLFHARIVEPEPTQKEAAATRATPSVRAVLASLPRLVRQDRAFSWLIVVRVVASYVLVASAFFVVYATRSLGFDTADTGTFVSAQVAGLLVSGLLMSIVQDRFGPRLHMRLMMVLSMLAPALVLFAPHVAPGPGLRALMVAVFFVLGIGISSMGWPYINWTMEHAPDEHRPLYIGVLNTMAALNTLAPVLGGAIVGWAGYPAVFVAAVGFAALGLVLSRRVPSTR